MPHGGLADHRVRGRRGRALRRTDRQAPPGLREFCRPNNGYRAGASGQVYYDSCPPELAPAFLAAYDEGRELYVRERRVTDADAALAALHAYRALVVARQ